MEPMKLLGDPDELHPRIGFELEIESPTGDPHHSSIPVLYQKVLAIAKGLFFGYHGNDGGGIEMRSCPAPIMWLQNRKALLDNVLDIFRNAKYKGDNSEQAGMHVHIHRSAFSAAQLFRLLKFFTNEADFCWKISGRSKSRHGYAMVGQAQLINGKYTIERPGHTRVSLRKFVLGTGGHTNRNSGFSCNNMGTIEFRMFNSTTNVDKLLANLEFVASIFVFTKVSAVRHMNLDTYCRFMGDSREEFPHMWNQLIKLGYVQAEPINTAIEVLEEVVVAG